MFTLNTMFRNLPGIEQSILIGSSVSVQRDVQWCTNATVHCAAASATKNGDVTYTCGCCQLLTVAAKCCPLLLAAAGWLAGGLAGWLLGWLLAAAGCCWLLLAAAG